MTDEDSPGDSGGHTDFLRDLVRLELKRGCQDDAAVGGFSRLALSAVDELVIQDPKGSIRGTVDQLRSLLADYQFLPVAARIDRCRKILAFVENDASVKSVVPPARRFQPEKGQTQAASTGSGDDMDILLDVLKQPVSRIWGVGPRVQETLARLGIATVADLLQHAPRGYLDLRLPAQISRESLGKAVMIKGHLLTVTEFRRKTLIVKATVRDPVGHLLRLVWFNNRFVRARLQPGHDYDFYGKLENSFDGAQLIQPAFEESGTPAAQLHMNRIVPLYHLTSGISQKTLRSHVWQAVKLVPTSGAEYLPPAVAARFQLPDLGFSYRSLHFPSNEEEAEKARSRFAFDSLFLFEVRVLMHRHAEQQTTGMPFDLPGGTVEHYAAHLPFVPTASQLAAMRDIERDVPGPRCMHRLLHGDVGSGKTAVAGYAAYAAKIAGFQSAVLSPTEILAEQTGHVLEELLDPLGVRVGILTGGMTKARHKEVMTLLATGGIDCLVGTHAILEEGIVFARLGLTVVDEQHRFGVEQRSALSSKGTEPHSLVMSATPIPRTLALTVYGDLDISELTEKPRGRLPVQTRLLRPGQRESAYALVRKQVSEGRQAFVVVPAIDSGSDEEEGTASVQEMMRELTEGYLQGLRVASLHGRMKSKDKESVMESFRSGQLDVLVATTVVEVGVDVPNATVMVVENAERFGLATLHQLRGRVGRGSSGSYCLLVEGSENGEGAARLQILVNSDDGFQIAEEDLKLRGPGDILGTVQHGYDVPLFGSTGLLSYRDLSMLPEIREEASRLLDADPTLAAPDHVHLADMMSLRYPASKTHPGEN